MRNKSTKQRKIVDHFESSTFTKFKDAARAKLSRVELSWTELIFYDLSSLIGKLAPSPLRTPFKYAPVADNSL